MSTIEAALAGGSLPDYGGRQVVRTSISIRNAGDGLSEGLGIDPQVLPLGETVYVVLECVVHAHDHDRIMDKGNDTGLLVLDQVLKAGTGTLIDADVVKTAIAEQAEKIVLAKEAAAGTQRLPFDEELLELHTQGAHAGGLVAGCVECDKEAAKVEEEKAADADPADEPSDDDDPVEA
jgi:hypothetical protein